jgi:hypothetical protein
VFRRTALERVGGYDATFTRAQDWEMNYRIRTSGGQVYFSPSLSVGYRPRGSLRKLAEQYFHYGRWRRQVMRTHPASVSLRYLAPPVALVGIVAGLVGGVIGAASGPRGLVAAFVLPLGYCLLVALGGLVAGSGLTPRARLAMPGVLATMHLAWGAGFLSSWRPGRGVGPS